MASTLNNMGKLFVGMLEGELHVCEATFQIMGGVNWTAYGGDISNGALAGIIWDTRS